MSIGFDEINVAVSDAEQTASAGDDIAAVCGLLYRLAPIGVNPAVVPGPDRIAFGIRFDQVEIFIAGIDAPRHDIPAVRRLLNRVATFAAVGSLPVRLGRGN